MPASWGKPEARRPKTNAPIWETDVKRQARLLSLFRLRSYWLPKPFWSPQSGHCQVMPLQDIPHTFSSMQAWQMEKPQRHCQVNRPWAPQQWQSALLIFRRRSLNDDVLLEEVFMVPLDASVHDHIDPFVRQQACSDPVFDAELHPGQTGAQPQDLRYMPHDLIA